MHNSDDLYLGGFLGGGLVGVTLMPTPGQSNWPPGSGAANPTRQQGVGPMGRIAFKNIVPATPTPAALSVLAAQTAATPLVLIGGTGGIVAVPNGAPDGSGATIYVFDQPRCLSLTSAGNLSAGTFLVTGYDIYGQKMTQLMTGPNANTVTSLKAFWAISSIVPNTTSATTISAGTSNIYGLDYAVLHAEYVIAAKWNGALAADAGTLVAAVTTSPATNLTGDVRGTYAPSSAADGTKRLTLSQHLDGSQCGPNSILSSAIGVPQV